MDTPVEVFVTKYALSQGVFKLVGHVYTDGVFSNSRVPRPFGAYAFYLSKNEFALTVADAEAQVAKMLAAKFKAAEKALKRLQSINPATLVSAAKPVQKVTDD
jgi:hypothetical protein